MYNFSVNKYNTILPGQVFLSNLTEMTALSMHPDTFRKSVEEQNINPYQEMCHILGRDLVGMIISVEPGTTFQYMKCNFVKLEYYFVDVTHYQILIEDKVYWQSFQSVDNFHMFWRKYL